MFEKIKSYFNKTPASPQLKTANYGAFESFIFGENDNALTPSKAINYYTSNPYVFRAVQLIARSLAKVPWLLYTKDNSEVQEIYDHEILDLIRQPNPQEGQAYFLECLVTNLYLFGDAYIYANKASNKIKELYLLNPQNVKIKTNLGLIDSYDYKVNNKTVNYSVEDICHLKFYNPSDPLYGLSPIQSIIKSILLNNDSKQYNISLLKNSARPSGALKLINKDGNTLSENEFNLLKQSLKDQYTGPNNTGNVMLLPNDLDWINFAQSLNDMEYTKILSISAQEICTALGIPSSLLVEANKTYDSAKQSNLQLYTNCILPLLTLIRDFLSPFLCSDTAYFLDYDIDKIEVMHEQRASLVGSIKDANWLSINEKRAIMGYSPLKEYGDTVPILLGDPRYSAALSDQVNSGNSNINNDNQKSDTLNLISPIASGGLLSIPLKKKLNTDDFRASQLEHTLELRRAIQDPARTKIQALLDDERASILQQLKDGVSLDLALTSEDAWSEVLTSLYTDAIHRSSPLYTLLLSQGKSLAGVPGATPLSTKADSNPPMDLWAQFLREYLAKHSSQKIQKINETTKQQVINTLILSQNSGDNLQETINKIDSLYLDQIIPNRSEVIARTETIQASNLSSLFVAKSTGLDMQKEWLSTNDNRTRGSKPKDRYDHVDMDGQVVKLDDPFVDNKTGEQLLYPGDQSLGASAGNVIQCRCTQTYIVV